MVPRLIGWMIGIQFLLDGCAPSGDGPIAGATTTPAVAPAPPPPPPPPPTAVATPSGTVASPTALQTQSNTIRRSSPAEPLILPKELAEFAVQNQPEVLIRGELTGFATRLRGVEISGDGSCAVTIDRQNRCRAWNANTRELVSMLEPLEGKLTCLIISHDGKY